MNFKSNIRELILLVHVTVLSIIIRRLLNSNVNANANAIANE